MFDPRADSERTEAPDIMDAVRYLSLRVDDQLHERVRAAADRDMRTLTAWLTRAVIAALEAQEEREAREERERQERRET
jgi:hypothetical protein